ncbi:MAG TPA: BamA/TamA family outer membrane protein, partial [Candidatus Tripitaka californicus]|uniref:BamA/TamA family outer membrane protein n=1 Tax=Candidatus Tripitaka californicus TaxID=3367616 RepID=UPI004025B66B
IFELQRWGKHVLSFRGTMGVVRPHSGEKEVPVFERYFAGGTGSIRGFDFRGVAPVDSKTKEQIGGDTLLLAGVEETFPIIKRFLSGAFFVDIGKADNNLGLGKMRASIATGVRITLPFLGRMSIGLDFGIPLMKQSEDDTKLMSINIGGAGAGAN